MIGFDPLSLSTAYILASLTAAQCPAQGPVDVDVQFIRKDSPAVTSQTSSALTKNEINDPNSTMATDGKWMVGGVTVIIPGINLKDSMNASFQSVTEVRTGAACFTVAKVKYAIEYDPAVFIASDFLGMGCRYSATLMHEKRHVDTDIKLMTDYVPEFRKAIENIAPTIGPQGPYAVGDVQAQQQRVIKQIGAGLAPLWAQFWAQRRTKQAEIDTVQNYMRDTALCPGQFPKFDGSK